MIIRLFQRHALLRFLVVGGVNTAFGFGIYAVSILAGLHYAAAVLLAMLIGTLFNFSTIGRVVFRRRDRRLYGKFVLVYAVSYVLNVGLLRIAAGFGIDMLVAGAFAIVPVAIGSFLMHRFFVFGKPAEAAPEVLP